MRKKSVKRSTITLFQLLNWSSRSGDLNIEDDGRNHKHKTYTIIRLVGIRKRMRTWADTTSNFLKRSTISFFPLWNWSCRSGNLNIEDDGRNPQEKDIHNNQHRGTTEATDKLGRYDRQLLEEVYSYAFSANELQF